MDKRRDGYTFVSGRYIAMENCGRAFLDECYLFTGWIGRIFCFISLSPSPVLIIVSDFIFDNPL